MKTNVVITGDCIAKMRAMPEASVNLVFADPPFNIGHEYDEYQDNRDPVDYVLWSRQWIDQCHRVLNATGSFFVAIGDEYAAEVCMAAKAAGFTMRNWIVWHYTFGTNCKAKFTRSHTHILYFVKDPKAFTFEPDRIRVASARQAVYGDRRADAKGKIPDDTWVLRPDDDTRAFRSEHDTWASPRVCGTFAERTDHPCQMPEAVLDRIIQVASNTGDIVLDPFAGSGTTLAVAKRLQRRYIGIETSKSYVAALKKRLAKTKVAK